MKRNLTPIATAVAIGDSTMLRIAAEMSRLKTLPLSTPIAAKFTACRPLPCATFTLVIQPAAWPPEMVACWNEATPCAMNAAGSRSRLVSAWPANSTQLKVWGGVEPTTR